MLVALPLAASVASFPLCARQRSSASLSTLQSRLFAYRFSRAIARIFEARGLNVVQLSLAGASKRFHDELYIYIYICIYIYTVSIRDKREKNSRWRKRMVEEEGKGKKRIVFATIEWRGFEYSRFFEKNLRCSMGLRHARLQIWVYFGRGMQLLVDANDFTCISLSFFFLFLFFLFFSR